MKRPKAITFDVGGTLIEPFPSVGHVYADVAAEYGFKVIPAVLDKRFRSAWKDRGTFQHTRDDWARLVDRTFGDLLARGATRVFFDALYARFAEAKSWRVFDDVWPTIQSLKRYGIPLGIISNWDERLHPLLRRLKLECPFTVIISSHQAGHLKPAKEIFRAAAEGLSCTSPEILHVGDSMKEDIEGAKAAGMQAFLLERPRNSLSDICSFQASL